jgi:hypothetical protein
MQMVGAFSTELINLILIRKFTSSQEIIMNLLAFGVIAQVDDLYA